MILTQAVTLKLFGSFAKHKKLYVLYYFLLLDPDKLSWQKYSFISPATCLVCEGLLVTAYASDTFRATWGNEPLVF